MVRRVTLTQGVVTNIKQLNNNNHINHVIIDHERVQLERSWKETAKELGITGYDLTLLACHFDGISSLESDLSNVSKDLSTNWIKLSNSKRSSKYKLDHGSIKYVTSIGKEIKASVKARSKRDKHTNYYLSYGNHYVHRLAAKAVMQATNDTRDLKGLVIHHRLIDETATTQGNQLCNLILLSKSEHNRLHYLLNKISDYVASGAMQLTLF